MKQFAFFCLWVLLCVPNLFAQVQKTNPTEGLHSAEPQWFLIQNATVHVSGDRYIEACNVLIHGEKIIAVGTDVTAPNGTKVVNAEGKHVYPGFVDAYLPVAIESEVSPSNRYWNEQIVSHRSLAQTNAISGVRVADYRKAGFTAALIAPNSGIVSGRSAIFQMSESATNESIVKADVAMHMQLTTRFGFGRSPGGPTSPMGAYALARQAIYDAQWYRDSWQVATTNPSAPRPETNISLENLQSTLKGELPVVINASNEIFSLRAKRFANEFGLRLIIVGSGNEYRRLDEIAALQTPMIVPLDFPETPSLKTANEVLDASLEDLMHWDHAPENPARLQAAGVEFAFTSDGITNKADFLKQLRAAVKRGLPAENAINSLTSVPAKIFGVDHLMGTISRGKLANLVIADGDLFDDKTKIVETWVGGVRDPYDLAPVRSLDGLWKVSSPQEEEAFFVKLTSKPKLAIKISKKRPTAKSEKTKPNTDETKANEDESDPESDEATDSTSTSDKQVADDLFEEDLMGSSNDDDDYLAFFNHQGHNHPYMFLRSGVMRSEYSEYIDEPADTKGGREGDKGDNADLKNAAFADSQLSGQFDATLVGGEGQAVLSVQFDSNETGSGIAVLPDGSILQLTLSRVPPAAADADEETADEETTEEETTEEETKSTEDADQASESESADQEKDKNAEAVSESESANPQDDASSNEESKTKPAKNEQASFPVNYPFGDFGRTELPPAPTECLIKNVTIWTCGDAGKIENGSVLIGDGKIKAVFAADAELPEVELTVDGTGMHLTPGMIDCHSHMATDSGVNEVGQAITAEVRIGDFIDCDDITIYRQLAGGLTAANILHGSANPIGGQNQVIKLRWGANDANMKFAEAPAGIKFALGENVKQSNRREASSRYPQTRMGVEQLLRDTFQAGVEYAAQHAKWKQERQGLPPRIDLELETIAEIIRGERWIHCHSYRQDEVLALIRVLDDFGITIGSFQHILEGYKVADAIARHGGTASSFSDWWAYKFEVIDAIPYNGAIMHDAGIVVSFNSDDGELARHMNHEAAKAVRYGGVSEIEALKFVTLNPAIQLRIDQYVGSIELGKHADLVLWSGHPLSVTSRCEQTWIDGRKYFDRAEFAALASEQMQQKSALVQKALSSGRATAASGGRRRVDESLFWPRFDEYCHGHNHEQEHGGAEQESHLNN